MSSRFREATERERDRIGRTLVAAKVFGDLAELRAEVDRAPWRLQVNDRGDVAVLGRWREHLPVLSIEALWCPSSAVPQAVSAFRQVARERGLDDVVSPPVPLEDREFYERAGMRPYTTVMTLARVILEADGEGVSESWLRQVAPDDLAALLAVDAECFEPFWRYDRTHMTRFLSRGRLVLAERDGEAVGYTLCTVDDDEGLLGRLCVTRAWRRKGIGMALLLDCLRYGRLNGARHMSLSTQVDNTSSQALYRAAGFRDTGRRYSFLRFGTDESR